MASSREDLIKNLATYQVGKISEYKGPDLDRFNGLVNTLKLKIESGEFDPSQVQTVFGADFSKLEKLAKVINTDKLTTYDTKGVNRTLVLNDILNHVYHRQELRKTATAFAQICQISESKDVKAEDRFDFKLETQTNKSLAGQGRDKAEQDVGQFYHTPLHAIEMRDDCQGPIDEMLKKAPLSELKINPKLLQSFIGGLAQHHDFIQLKGQFVNEQKSAEDYVRHFKTTFAEAANVDEKTLLAIASHIINRGTILSLAFEATGLKHVSLQSILINVDREVLGITSYTAEEQLLLNATLLLSHFDVSSMNAKTQRPLPDALNKALTAALAEQKIELKTDEGQDFSSAFRIATGQNTRMMADGPEEKRLFTKKDIPTAEKAGINVDSARKINSTKGSPQKEKKEEKIDMLPILHEAFDKARILDLHPDSKVLLKEFIDFVQEHLGVFKTGIDFSGQLGFANGISSSEAYQSMQKVSPEVAKAFAASLASGTASPQNVKQIETNTWKTHAKIVKGLTVSLESAKQAESKAESVEDKNAAVRKSAELYSAIISNAANQRGLDLLASEKYRDTLKNILEKNFNISPAEFNPALAKQYVISYMSILMSENGNQLIKNLETKPENLAALRSSFDSKMREIAAAELRAGKKAEAKGELKIEVSAPQDTHQRTHSSAFAIAGKLSINVPSPTLGPPSPARELTEPHPKAPSPSPNTRETHRRMNFTYARTPRNSSLGAAGAQVVGITSPRHRPEHDEERTSQAERNKVASAKTAQTSAQPTSTDGFFTHRSQDRNTASNVNTTPKPILNRGGKAR